MNFRPKQDVKDVRTIAEKGVGTTEHVQYQRMKLSHKINFLKKRFVSLNYKVPRASFTCFTIPIIAR